MFGCNWAPIVPLPSIFLGNKVSSRNWSSLLMVITRDLLSIFWISLTSKLTASSPAANSWFSTFIILSPGSNPALKAAFSGCMARTDIPGSGSYGIPIAVTFNIKIK